MKLIKRSLTVIDLTITLALITHGIAAAQTKVSKTVLGNGSTAFSNNSFRLNGTIGQPVIGRMSSSSLINEIGFWFPSSSCTYSISPTSRSHGSGAETGTVSVTTASGCSWTASSNDTWITITSGGSGNGNGTVSYSITANTGANSRTGTLTIAGQAFTVTQAGCVYSISPTSRTHEYGAETGTVTVTVSSNVCNWTAISNATWITITSGGSGSGNGTVGYTVAANPSINSRTGTLTIAEQTFTVTQRGIVCT